MPDAVLTPEVGVINPPPQPVGNSGGTIPPVGWLALGVAVGFFLAKGRGLRAMDWE